ncbi:MAG TPA: L,D-transpeptidase, partial [Candidatus Sulfotelmatobacter sp.]|nr:L,D-transpeptidase [Candidatus Sulfotelmatobacter sp.]
MRRLVGISGKTKKAFMALMALIISLTSLHMAAAARIASLRLQQDKFEQSATSNQPTAQNSLSSPTALIQSGSVLNADQQVSKPAPIQSTNSNPADAVPAHRRQIIISITDRKLALMEDGQLLKTYPIAVGTRGTPSPDGDFVIINHARDPIYRHGDKEVAPGKDNPLGSRWMGLSLKGYGIHGTNVQSSVGKAASHGCFRMR